MKKLIAMVLAVALSLSMAAVAFAAPLASSEYDNALGPDDAVAPGSKIAFTVSDFDAVDSGSLNGNYFTSEYFSVTIKYNKGSSLVESVKFDDDDGELILTLRKNNNLKAPNISNIEIRELTVKAKKDGSGFDRGDVFELKSKFLEGKFVGYTINKLAPGLVVGDSINLSEGESGLFEFAADGSTRYDTSDFTFGNIAYGEMRVYEKDKFFISYDADADYDILKKYPDAELEFVNLVGEFNTSMNFELYADEDYYVYELVGGKLRNTSLKWDKDISAYAGKVRSLPTYVISDTRLKISSTTDSSDSDTDTTPDADNPDTGANTMVGVAAALAVVSLVAAGAVSFKKK